MHIRAHPCTFVHIRAYARAHTSCICTDVHVHMHECARMCTECARMCTCICTNVHVHMHECSRMCTNVHECARVHMHVHIRAHSCTCGRYFRIEPSFDWFSLTKLSARSIIATFFCPTNKDSIYKKPSKTIGFLMWVKKLQSEKQLGIGYPASNSEELFFFALVWP